jgi:hypothetical protein
MKRKKRNSKPPAYIWADCDPDAPRSVRWAFYNTLADQRSNRPDLKPIKLRIVPNAESSHPAGERKHD